MARGESDEFTRLEIPMMNVGRGMENYLLERDPVGSFMGAPGAPRNFAEPSNRERGLGAVDLNAAGQNASPQGLLPRPGSFEDRFYGDPGGGFIYEPYRAPGGSDNSGGALRFAGLDNDSYGTSVSGGRGAFPLATGQGFSTREGGFDFSDTGFTSGNQGPSFEGRFQGDGSRSMPMAPFTPDDTPAGAPHLPAFRGSDLMGGSSQDFLTGGSFGDRPMSSGGRMRNEPVTGPDGSAYFFPDPNERGAPPDPRGSFERSGGIANWLYDTSAEVAGNVVGGIADAFGGTARATPQANIDSRFPGAGETFIGWNPMNNEAAAHPDFNGAFVGGRAPSESAWRNGFGLPSNTGFPDQNPDVWPQMQEPSDIGSTRIRPYGNFTRYLDEPTDTPYQPASVRGVNQIQQNPDVWPDMNAPQGNWLPRWTPSGDFPGAPLDPMASALPDPNNFAPSFTGQSGDFAPQPGDATFASRFPGNRTFTTPDFMPNFQPNGGFDGTPAMNYDPGYDYQSPGTASLSLPQEPSFYQRFTGDLSNSAPMSGYSPGANWQGPGGQGAVYDPVAAVEGGGFGYQSPELTGGGGVTQNSFPTQPGGYGSPQRGLSELGSTFSNISPMHTSGMTNTIVGANYSDPPQHVSSPAFVPGYSYTSTGNYAPQPLPNFSYAPPVPSVFGNPTGFITPGYG